MKENQIEFVFIGVIIIVFAIWKISELIKTRCYQAKAAIQEGFEADDRAKKDKAAAVAAAAAEAEPELMTQLKGLLKNYNTETPVLSTENFTVETPENEMTINQRKKAATTLDTFKTTTATTTATAPTTATTPPPVAAPTTDKPINAVKEGLENMNEDTKEFIDKNITSINPADSQSKFKLRDYYIKSAYNAFNPDKFKNSNVSMDALLYVIARGCRFIDFEVFSVENQPVIASSSVNSFNYKETFNHIPVSDAFEVLGSYVFSGSKCPNPGDPFIIHMRIM